MLLCEYYSNWIKIYKENAVRQVTLDKYYLTLKWIKEIAADMEVETLDRTKYQGIINEYARTHEKQTVIDFNHHLKAAIKDAIDEGLLDRDPTRRIVIKGKAPRDKKKKFLNQHEVHKLIEDLNLKNGVNTDWLILIIIKTGMRYSEALGLTPKDFDFLNQTISINKTWDYKNGGGFVPTKNKSSVRTIQIDWQIVGQFSQIIKELPDDEPIFVKKNSKVYCSTANDILARHCRKCKIPIITIHGLRHTHASMLLSAGVSTASVSKRLGHSDITTTQKVYLHIIQELEDKDTNTIMKTMAVL